jgi:hypothetical protein
LGYVHHSTVEQAAIPSPCPHRWCCRIPPCVQASLALQHKNDAIIRLQNELQNRKQISNEEHRTGSDDCWPSNFSRTPLTTDTSSLDTSAHDNEDNDDDIESGGEAASHRNLDHVLDRYRELERRAEEAEEAAATLAKQVKEKDAIVAELATLIATREASELALVKNVQTFINQSLSSLPATPRDQAVAAGTAAMHLQQQQQRMEAMAHYLQDRLQAKAESSTPRLMGIVPSDPNDNTVLPANVVPRESVPCSPASKTAANRVSIPPLALERIASSS